MKIIVVGPDIPALENETNQPSSLNLEHVSPDALARRGISRHTPRGPAAEAATLALMRRWFWMRKPDAGFVINGFPATLLQAKVFDEWLDARGENLDAVIDATAGNTEFPLGEQHVIQHYRDQGLLLDPAAVPLAA